MNVKLTVSLVLFNNDLNILRKVINSFFNTNLILNLYLVDNSATDNLKILANNEKIEYYHNPSNPGFGAAHNVAIKKAIAAGSQYHFIVNPDIYFDEDIITPMVEYMKNNNGVGMIMPQILNLDGTIQNLPKLLPSPFSILLRKIKRPRGYYKKFIEVYELRNVPQQQIYNTPILSGCFTLLNLKAIEEIGMYDDNYFMYFEDWDLSRRMHQKFKTIYYPLVSVYHGYDSGANKSFKLFKIFIRSAFTYFNKWGWFFDQDRKQMNKKALSQFE
jgi:GT2 family glycosyltransferase